MKFIIFFIYVPFVYSELHSFITTYTGIIGETVAGIPEFSAVTTLDGQQIDYYDSDAGMLIPRQDWMKEFASGDTWKKDTKIRKQVQQIYKHNIAVLMERFNQTHGVHTYQRMYGCEWDHKTDISHGFDQYGYDGQGFITLDVENSRYNTSVPQAFDTVEKWNNDGEQLDHLQQYYKYECIYWLKIFLKKSSLVKKAPEVSLLQKNSSSPVVCHATGFYPSAVNITWRKNKHYHIMYVKIGDTLPNEDGTFQKNVTLDVPPDDWKMDQFACVVKHVNLTEPIQKILTEDEIKSNNKSTILAYVYIILALIAFLMFVFASIVLLKCRSEVKAALFTGYKKVRMFI